MSSIAARIGIPIDEIDTPALLVDTDALAYNLKKMADFAKSAGVRLRPHAKSHKCPTIARMQIAAGAVGLCCQKVGEAEALVRGGIVDVMVTNQIVGMQKLRRLSALAREASISLCFDAPEQIDEASRAASEAGVRLGGLVELNIDLQRCGVSDPEGACDLARRITEAPGLYFRGIQAYHGMAQHRPTVAEREHEIRRAADLVRATVERLRRAAIPCELVCGAGTGTYRMEGLSGLWNELQAGSYVFMDVDYARIGGYDTSNYTEFRHSLFVLSTVMSVPSPDRVVVDAGVKSYTTEKALPCVHGRQGLTVVGAADEHGMIKLAPDAQRLSLGDKIMLIPGHCDPTVNLHDWFVAVRGGRVESLWPISARGAST